MKGFLRTTRSRRIILIAGTTALMVGHRTIPLWDQDEAAYAGFAHNMVASGDWLVPDFWWSDVHRKPPLHFWVTAASFKAFGEIGRHGSGR